MKTILLLAAVILITGSFTIIATSPESLRTTAASVEPAFPPASEAGAAMKAGYAYQAMEWQFRMRAHPTGNIPADWREKALESMAQAQLATEKNPAGVDAVSALTWLSLGPDNIGGRIRSIAIDPSNTAIIYCGSVSGGVWKTTNAGSDWFPTNDLADNLVIGALAIDPNNSSIIYAGTGEGYFNIDALRGAGILKSTDAGATWVLKTAFSGYPNPNPGYPYYINDIYIRPDNSSLLFAATNSGLFRSTNSGESWVWVTKNSGTRRATQIVADAINPGTFYVAYGNFSTDGIYKTTDGGASFSKLAGGFPTNGFYRISMGISKGDPSVLYAVLTDTISYGTHSIQKTTNGGASWTAVTKPTDLALGGTHLGNQGWYNNVVAVHPTDVNRVYVGGINSFRSTNGGAGWSQMTNGYPSGYPFMHVDQHAIAFDPNNPLVIYFGNDGGMYKSVDGGSSFSAINNGLAVTQFYSGAAHPFAETYYGGTQDNGTLKTSGAPVWTTALGGDGGATAVDFLTPTTVYTEYVYLNFQRSLNSGVNWARAMSGIPTSGNLQSDGTSDRCAFIAPFVMDPSNPQVLVAGTYRVYRTTNGGTSWGAVGSGIDLTGEAGGAGGVGSFGSVISALAIAKSSGTTIYAGTTGADSAARVQVTTNTGTTWVNVTKAPLPNRAVTSIAIDPTNASRAFVGFSGYAAGHIFRTTNRGVSWSNVSGNLPDVPVNAIALDTAIPQTHIVVGTDLGIFETTNGGTSWTEANTGMARVSVADLDLRSDGILIAATHGRGMFKTAGSLTSVRERPSGVPDANRLAQNYPNPFNPSTTIVFDLASASQVDLRVYDAAGREVAKLFDGPLGPGSYEREFDGTGIASGVYFYVIESRASDGIRLREMKKMLLLR